MVAHQYKYSMTTSSAPLFRACLLVGALTAAGGAAYVANNIAAPEPVQVAAPVVPQMETKQVLVLANDVKIGEKLEGQTLRWQEWPASSVSANFVTKSATPDAVDTYVGRIVTAALPAGQPLSLNFLHDGKTDFLAGTLPSGKRAYSVKISPETSAGGFILPEDRVDVVLTREERGPEEGQRSTYVSETVLSNVQVLAIDQITDRKEGKSRVAVGKTATLEVDPRQAESLAVSEKLGTVSLMLRSVADAGQTKRRYKDNSTVPMRIHTPQNGEIKVASYSVQVDHTLYDTRRLALNSGTYLASNN